MAKIRRIPFKNLLFLQERISRAFDDAVSKHGGFGDGSRTAWCPPADIYETEDAVVVKAEVPGVELKDIDVELTEGVLVISGERTLDKNLKDELFHRLETSYGAFRRRFNLPPNVDEKGIKASLTDGVLEVSVPKGGKRKKNIKVDVK